MQKVVWMRETWWKTRKRQTTDSFGNFEDMFSEPVALATGEADWLIGNRLRNFLGKHSRTRKMAEDAIYIFPTRFGKSVIFYLVLKCAKTISDFTWPCGHWLISHTFELEIDQFYSAYTTSQLTVKRSAGLTKAASRASVSPYVLSALVTLRVSCNREKSRNTLFVL